VHARAWAEKADMGVERVHKDSLRWTPSNAARGYNKHKAATIALQLITISGSPPPRSPCARAPSLTCCKQRQRLLDHLLRPTRKRQRIRPIRPP
jgi:hypothetical protein